MITNVEKYLATKYDVVLRPHNNIILSVISTVEHFFIQIPFTFVISSILLFWHAQ